MLFTVSLGYFLLLPARRYFYHKLAYFQSIWWKSFCLLLSLYCVGSTHRKYFGGVVCDRPRQVRQRWIIYVLEYISLHLLLMIESLRNIWNWVWDWKGGWLVILESGFDSELMQSVEVGMEIGVFTLQCLG